LVYLSKSPVGRNPEFQKNLFRKLAVINSKTVSSTPIYKTKTARILTHICFWIFIVGFFTFIYGVRKGSYFIIFKVLLGTLPVDIGFTYFILYFLIPRFLLVRKYIHFFVFLALSFTVVVIIEWTINFYVMYPLVYPDYNEWKDKIHYLSGDAFMLYISIGFVVLLASAIKLVRYWLQSQQAKTELEIQNKQSELALLRSQINPHFLFNTLNNIDTLIRKDPDMASDSMVRLSEIMRYIIYEATTDSVPLKKEIDYLTGFIELQRLRYKNPDYIFYEVTGSPEGKQIAPMMFIPFVENAFKHGIRRNQSPGISISLNIHDSHLRLLVWNYFEPLGQSAKDPVKGIGLANVERRLNLLYPGKFILNINQEEDKFKTELILHFR